jgi:hypothetical protein
MLISAVGAGYVLGRRGTRAVAPFFRILANSTRRVPSPKSTAPNMYSGVFVVLQRYRGCLAEIEQQRQNYLNFALLLKTELTAQHYGSWLRPRSLKKGRATLGA